LEAAAILATMNLYASSNKLTEDWILPAINIRKMIWVSRLPYNHFKNSIDYDLIE
jgi:hypothetical protein